MAWKPCSFCRGIGINFAVEFVFFLPWNPCSLWRGIFSLDIAVNNAGKETLGMVTDVTGEAFGEVFKTNVLGTLLSLKHEFRAMKAQGKGSVVNIGSVYGHKGFGG